MKIVSPKGASSIETRISIMISDPEMTHVDSARMGRVPRSLAERVYRIAGRQTRNHNL
jgi:hypothetical protein